MHLPKDTLKKLNIGQSFAEYDIIRDKAGVVVDTPAMRSALDRDRSKCFFIGRRGTGKTAITFQIAKTVPRTLLLLPQLFSPIEKFFSEEQMDDVHQRPFKTLVTSFKRSLIDEVIGLWVKRGLMSLDRRTTSPLTRERNMIEDYDFDTRLMQFADDAFSALNKGQDKEWHRHINRTKELTDFVGEIVEDGWETTVMLDRIDESWDGSDSSVVLVMALMHACVELTATSKAVRPLVFLRENVFERILIDDLQEARRVFSNSRLKELADEYADNYPQLQLVLARFFGLGRQFTIQGIEDFIRKLLVDNEVKQHCQKWIFRHTQPDLFIKLLYDIGFVGIKEGDSIPVFRSSGPQGAGLPPIGLGTLITVHPTYTDALNLQNSIVNSSED
jgi:hypothetical protein